MASAFDLTILGFQVKLLVLASAWQLPVPLPERLPLIRLAIGNLGRANLQRPFDVGVLIETRRRELDTLRSTMAERSRLVASLRLEIAKRRDVLNRAAGSVLEPAMSGGSAAPDVHTTLREPLDPLRAPDSALREPLDLDQDYQRRTLLDYFRPTPLRVLALCQRLNEEIGMYRQVCDEQLRTIDDLHAQAGALLTEMLATEKREASTHREDAEI